MATKEWQRTRDQSQKKTQRRKIQHRSGSVCRRHKRPFWGSVNIYGTSRQSSWWVIVKPFLLSEKLVIVMEPDGAADPQSLQGPPPLDLHQRLLCSAAPRFAVWSRDQRNTAPRLHAGAGPTSCAGQTAVHNRISLSAGRLLVTTDNFGVFSLLLNYQGGFG